MIEKFYLDLDGVHAGFNEKFLEVFGVYPYEIPDKLMWNSIKDYENNGGRWFYDLDLLPGALDMFEFVKSTGIPFQVLTATGYDFENVTAQKVAWCKKHLGIHDKNDIITVVSSKHKARYANPKHLLIDDSPHSVDPFVEAGGKAILHTSPMETIKKIQKMLKI